MIKVIVKECREGNFAIQTVKVTFFCIPVFKYKKISTNNKAVELLTVVSQSSKIKGFV